MSATYWLIEYREGGQTVAYLMDMWRDVGGVDVVMTKDSANALRFDSQMSAQSIINDWAFQRTVPRSDQFFVEEHIDCAGPTHAEIDALNDVRKKP
jgi:hypothetical protein